MTTWQYYDFTNNWDYFYNIWISDEVQDVLEPHMDVWCKEEAYFISEGVKPTWKRKDDLWTYGRTDYFATRIDEKADAYIEKYKIKSVFKKQMANVGIKYKTEDLLYEAFFETCYEEISKMFEPIPHSQEANVLMMGANYLTAALCEAARIIYPNEYVEEYENENGDDLVIIPNIKVIFDFHRHFHYTEGDQQQSPEALKLLWKLH